MTLSQPDRLGKIEAQLSRLVTEVRATNQCLGETHQCLEAEVKRGMNDSSR